MKRYRHILCFLLALCLVPLTVFAFTAAPSKHNSKISPTTPLKETLQKSSESTDTLPHLIFPGGGIFFYWQAGVVSYLREEGYNLHDVTLAGASAGALTATLAATNVDFYNATSLALELAEEEGVWDRRGGLQGVWGSMIERWLDELLPSNAVDCLHHNRLSLLVTPVPSFGKSRVSEFADKADLIRCNMASVHLPLFLDSKFTTMFRERPHIDGSFLARIRDYVPDDKERPILVLSHNQDPAMEGKALQFVSTVSKDSIWALLERGKTYAKTMETRGDFNVLQRYERE